MSQPEPKSILSSLPAPWGHILPLGTRVLVWGIFFGILYILRSFFLLLFLTFVFVYFQSSSLKRLEPYIKLRAVRVILIFSVFLGILTMVGFFLAPRVMDQAGRFINQFPSYIESTDKVLFNIGDKYPMLTDIIPELKKTRDSNTLEYGKDPLSQPSSPTAAMFQILTGVGEESTDKENIKQIIGKLRNVGENIASIVSYFLLALLFSFLILLDLPTFSKNFTKLKDTKIDFIYNEVADSIRDFALVLGQALEAQFIIAIFNTTLTAIGITMLGLSTKVAFLSVIVFFCSFIPVIGVFISSVPICLVALQSSGPNTLLLAIVLITVIHLIEAYILNPRIYGSHMRINPVIVLIILTVSGKLFYIWGLILGVPVYTYIFGTAIRKEPEDIPLPEEPPLKS
jgi:predicted PurR-regulated permease PerM